MTRARVIFYAISGLALIVSLTIWWAAISSRRAANQNAAALAAQRAGLVAGISRLERQLVEAEDLSSKTTGALAGFLSKKLPTSAAAAVKPKAPTGSQRALIATDPRLEALSLKSARAVTHLEYGPLFDALGLSPEQIKKFEDNYVEFAEWRMDLFGAGQSQDVAGQQTVAALEQQAKADYEAAQTNLLGAEGFQRIREFVRALPARNIVVLGPASAAALEGVPFSAQQGEQLWQAAIAAAHPDPNAHPGDILKTIDWPALDAQARQILSPAQFALFKNVAPPSGFSSHLEHQFEAVLQRAQEAEASDKK